MYTLLYMAAGSGGQAAAVFLMRSMEKIKKGLTLPLRQPVY